MDVTFGAAAVHSYSHLGWSIDTSYPPLILPVAYSCTMEAHLSTIKVVTLPDMKSKFKIPEDEVVMVDNKPFVQLTSNKYGLGQLMCEGNPDAPPHSVHGLSGYHTGLDKLVQMRNDAQDTEMLPTGGSSTLFNTDDEDKPKQAPKRKPRQSRMEIAGKRINKEVVQLTLEHNGACNVIEVLRQVHPMDGLYVLYDQKTMTAVLNFLRTSGFHKKEPRIQNQGAPGIQAIKENKKFWCSKGFLVVTKDEEGNKKFKKAKTLDEAFAKLGKGYAVHGDDDQPDDIGANGAEDHDGLNEHCKPDGGVAPCDLWVPLPGEKGFGAEDDGLNVHCKPEGLDENVCAKYEDDPENEVNYSIGA